MLLVDTLLDHRLLLVFTQRLHLQSMEINIKGALVQTRWPGGNEHHVALRREHLGDVPFDLFAHLATLIDSVQQDHCTTRHERLPHHKVRLICGPMLAPEVRVNPVPRARKYVAVILDEEQALQLLHLDEHGKESVRAARVG